MSNYRFWSRNSLNLILFEFRPCSIWHPHILWTRYALYAYLFCFLTSLKIWQTKEQLNLTFTDMTANFYELINQRISFHWLSDPWVKLLIHSQGRCVWLCACQLGVFVCVCVRRHCWRINQVEIVVETLLEHLLICLDLGALIIHERKQEERCKM